MIIVTFSMFMDEGETAIAANQETYLGLWADCEGNAESAVGDSVSGYWLGQDNKWEDCFGSDLEAEIKVTVHTPQSIAGEYMVDLSRPVQANARKLKP